MERKKDSATAGTRALLQKSRQSITAGMKLNLSVGTQLAKRQSRAGLVPVLSQARASLPAAALGQQTCFWPRVITNAVTCLLLQKPVRAAAPPKAESPT